MKQRRGGRGRPSRGAGQRWTVIAVIALAVLAAGALIWVGRPAEPARVANLPANANVLGSPSAPVTVEEWGDFQ